MFDTLLGRSVEATDRLYFPIMQNINIDRSIAIIEATLKDRHCLKELVFLAKKYPESINSFISLAESIEEDLNSRGFAFLISMILRWNGPSYGEARTMYSSLL